VTRVADGLLRSNLGLVTLCTLGLRLLNLVGKSSTSLSGWGESGVRSLVSGSR